MKKIISFLLCILILSGLIPSVFADGTVDRSAAFVYNTVAEPQVGSVGGEWAVIGLARSNYDVPEEYYQKYYEVVKAYVKENNGVLHDKKHTEYSRVILALTAIGKNPKNVAGYNLLTALSDYEKTIWQGINGPVWALIALDSGSYEIPQNPDVTTQATREMYIQKILDSQLDDGGWALGTQTDPDITAMTLQALSKYREREDVNKSIEKGLSCMSAIQDADGGFFNNGAQSSESTIQMIVALCELGISLEDERFVKNGNTLLDNLMTYSVSNGGFKHTLNNDNFNLMATEQALYGLVALDRFNNGKNSLYNMSDVTLSSDSEQPATGLTNKNPDVNKMSVTSHGKTFADIAEHKNRAEIEALTARNIINGKTESSFEPNATMTRAEFATIISRGLGLPRNNTMVFTDVSENDWYFNYINTAYYYGIIKGISETEFNPKGTITREEAAVMVARAAKLCGADTEYETFESRNILAAFTDYVTVSDWAVNSLAFCYDKGISEDDVMEIKPKESITRGEIACMLYNMLDLAKLL